ncbi:hypothetical protein Tco_0319948 [Tanacetum coccineum]
MNHHPLPFSLVASALVPWIYIQQFWHTLKLDDLKDKFKFFLDTKEFKFSVDDFKRVFQLPQATDNNNVAFVDAPTFSDMLPFFRNELGFSLPIRLPTHFRLHEHYHRVAKDEIVKSIFYFRKNKEGKGMQIPDSMLTEEMKLTRHYQMYVSIFRVDVPTTQSQLIESTQGTHRILSAPRTPNPATTQEVTQVSISTARSFEDLKAQQNVEKVKEHLVDEEIETMVEGTENVDEDEFMNEIFNDQKDPDTRLEPKSHKESLEVKKSVDILIINDDEEEESTKDDLISWKWKGIEKIRDTPPSTPIRSLGLILLCYLRIRRHSRN